MLDRSNPLTPDDNRNTHRTLNLLQVLTAVSRRGQFGGPQKVAFEQMKSLASVVDVNSKLRIYAGVLSHDDLPDFAGVHLSTRLVKPLSKKLPISTLWNRRVLNDLWKEIRHAEVIHIHFARDLIPIYAALLALTLRKPYHLQTHGMLLKNYRSITKLLDLIVIKLILKKAKNIWIFNESEGSEITSIEVSSKVAQLNNGLNFIDQHSVIPIEKRENAIVFCSRLHPRKCVGKFIESAFGVHAFHPNIKFEIYGPDDGDLSKAQKLIGDLRAESFISIEPPLNSQDVQNILSHKMLLVLPSKDEPFPMVVLEALQVGTPAIVMPSCGISSQLANLSSSLVPKSENVDDIVTSILSFLSSLGELPSENIANFAKANFDIKHIALTLVDAYER